MLFFFQIHAHINQKKISQIKIEGYYIIPTQNLKIDHYTKCIIKTKKIVKINLKH